MRYVFICIACLWGVASQATEVIDWAGTPIDVVIIGEVHDNPSHHARQASIISQLEPKAIVYEMLSDSEARALQPVVRDEGQMARAVDGFQWSNIADYAGVLAAGEGVIVGAAVPRDDVRAAFEAGAAEVFGDGAEVFGLSKALTEPVLTERKQLQFEAHCEAMPLDMMGGMIEAQRLRDASFARAVLSALETYGAPVVLITGNGHARKDWGVPAYLKAAAPEVSVITVGQSEAGRTPPGGFSTVYDAPAVNRPDPCAAFE